MENDKKVAIAYTFKILINNLDMQRAINKKTFIFWHQ